MRITLLQADVAMFGEPHSINWEKGEAVFAIFGVKDYDEAKLIMQKLGVMPASTETVDGLDEPAFRERTKENYGFDPGPTPAAADGPPVAPVQHTKPEDLKPGELAKGIADAKAGKVSKVPEEVLKSGPKAPTAAGKTATSTSVAESAAGTSDEDLGAFANMTSFAAAVAEIRKRGHQTYEAILAFVVRLQEIGDVCPPIDQLVDPKKPPGEVRARLEDRLKTHLTGKGIKVPE